MAISISNQYIYAGKGPFDAKSLVETYADLINKTTWTVDGSNVAYNGMIVAVWLDKSNTNNNGIYYLFDSSVDSKRKSPDVTNSANWHKISETVDLTSIDSLLANHEDRLAALESEDRAHTYGYRKDFPSEGQQNHMYIAEDQHRTYIYVSGQYLHIADQFEYTDHDKNPDTPDLRIIYGGSAD